MVPCWSQIILCNKIYCKGSQQITNKIIRCWQICTLLSCSVTGNTLQKYFFFSLSIQNNPYHGFHDRNNSSVLMVDAGKLILSYKHLSYLVSHLWPCLTLWPHYHINMDSYSVCHLNTSSRRLSRSRSLSQPPPIPQSVTRLFHCGAIESPASHRKCECSVRRSWLAVTDHYYMSLLACQKSQRSPPYNIVKSGLASSWVFRRRHIRRRVTTVTCLRWPTLVTVDAVDVNQSLAGFSHKWRFLKNGHRRLHVLP